MSNLDEIKHRLHKRKTPNEQVLNFRNSHKYYEVNKRII